MGGGSRVIRFTVSGDPVPQPRPRVSMRGGFARAYVPKDHPVHAYRQQVALAAKAAGLGHTKTPVNVCVVAVFKRPASHVTTRGTVKATAPKVPRPDVDNIAKAVLDALCDFFDDTLVESLSVSKSYGDESSTSVVIA
jgi:Holliday junction resolvase RusA-like endonuclease